MILLHAFSMWSEVVALIDVSSVDASVNMSVNTSANTSA